MLSAIGTVVKRDFARNQVAEAGKSLKSTGGRYMSSRISILGLAAIAMLLGTLGRSATVVAKEGSDRVVTFYKDVVPILQKNCQTCHRPGQIAPMSLLTYKEARPWAKAMKAAVVSRKMPPWFADPRYGHFNNDRSLKSADIETLVSWVDAAAGTPDHTRRQPVLLSAGFAV